MSNHTGKLVMDMWTKFKWWLRFGDFANEEYTRLPISELPATQPSDVATKQYIDEQQARYDRKTAMNVANVEIDVSQVREATKVLKVFTNECKKAEMALVSLTKSQLEAKRAANTKNLKENARSRQNVASEPAISSSEYDITLITCQLCGFLAQNWPTDAQQPHISPNSYRKDLLCVGTWLQNPNMDPNEAKTPEEALEFVKKKLDEAGILEKEVLEGPNCSENPNCDGNCCEKG